MRSPVCTLNCIIVIMLLGIRQNFYESKLITPIPLYESTLKIPFKVFLIAFLVFTSYLLVLFFCICNSL